MKVVNVVLCIGFLLSGNAAAAPSGWDMKAGVSASESYNDNINLVSTGAKTDDYITQINPYLSINRKTRRLNLQADYRMQNLIYANEDQNNTTFHQLSGNGEMNFVKDIFYIKGAANYSQQNIDQAATTSFNNVSVTNNRTNVAAININPYLKFRLGNTSDLKLSVDKGIVKYSGSLNDSDRDLYQANLTSGKAFNRLGWSLNASRQKINTDNQTDIIIQSYQADVQYKLTKKVSITAGVGADDNQYTRAISTENPDSETYTLGMNWNITPRTKINFGGVSHYFGDSFFLDINNKSRRTDLSVKYKEDVTALTATQFDQNENNINFNNDVSKASISNDAFVRKHFSGNFSLKSAKSVLKLSIFNEKRIYQTDDTSERIYGGAGSLDWKFGKRTSLLLSGAGQITNRRGSSIKDGLLQVSAEVKRQLRKKLSGSIGITHARRDTSINSQDYRQNMANISINWQL